MVAKTKTTGFVQIFKCNCSAEEILLEISISGGTIVSWLHVLNEGVGGNLWLPVSTSNTNAIRHNILIIESLDLD
jgi:hypothetical protein